MWWCGGGGDEGADQQIRKKIATAVRKRIGHILWCTCHMLKANPMGLLQAAASVNLAHTAAARIPTVFIPLLMSTIYLTL
jgi:hypothetical protein